jgi:uncharacterized protein YkwD
MKKIWKTILEFFFGKKKTKFPPIKPIVYKNEMKLSIEEYNLIDLVNAYRKENGLPALIPDDTLHGLAMTRYEKAIDHGKITHDWIFSDLITPLHAMGVEASAENLGENYKSPTTCFNAFKRSKSHRENMLDKDWKYTGVVIRPNKTLRNVYVQVFCT